eukprot:30331-Ditylum_brightwellii.AAC.1
MMYLHLCCGSIMKNSKSLKMPQLCLISLKLASRIIKNNQHIAGWYQKKKRLCCTMTEKFILCNCATTKES